MAVRHDLNIRLDHSQLIRSIVIQYVRELSYKVLELFHQRFVFVRKITGIDSKAVDQQTSWRRVNL